MNSSTWKIRCERGLLLLIACLTLATATSATTPEPPSEPVGMIWQYRDSIGWSGQWIREGSTEQIGSYVPFEGVFRRGEEQLAAKLYVRITKAGKVTVSRYNGNSSAGSVDCTYEGTIEEGSSNLLGEKASYLAKTSVRGQFRCLSDNVSEVFEWSAEFL